MRAALIALLAVLAATAAWAASPEDIYLAARNRAIAEIARQVKAGASDANVMALDDARRTKLADQLRPLLGAAPLPGKGELSPQTLEPDEGSDALDGILYVNADQTDHVLVSTPKLLRAWLDGTMHFKGKSFAAAFRSDDILTLAINTDAHFDLLTPLPVRAPPGVSVTAWLAKYEQDFGSEPPDEIAVAVATSDRVFLAISAAKTKPAHIPACDAGLVGAKATRQETKAEADYFRCWQAQGHNAPAFPAILRQAQAMADALTR